ncbi:MAG: NHL repeat-containing protein [Acidobacteriota bacterium]
MTQSTKTLLTLALAAGASFFLTGCGMTGGVTKAVATDPTPVKPATAALQGHVHGGQQPVSHSLIQLYAVNMGAAQGASAPQILGAPVYTDTNGYFNITTQYTCPSGAQVYISATGGNAGYGDNAGILLMAGLGPCSALLPTTNIIINEVTTVATVYALAPFMADATHVGAAVANEPGLIKAFNTLQILANTTNGNAPGPLKPANVVLNTKLINSLANSVASCINSTTGDTGCNALFTLATPPSGTAPADTVAALLNIARFPANNATAIYLLAQTNPPFQDTLNTAPADWTIALQVTSANLNSPYGLAIDASGNVWTTNEADLTVSKFDYLGNPINTFSNGGLIAPQGIAIDLSNNVWIANTGGASVVKLDNNGNSLSGSGFTNGGISAATDIQVDKNGNAWVASFDTDSITELDPSGNALNSSPIVEATGSAPVSLSIDPTGNVWVSNNGTGNVAKFSSTGQPAVNSPYTDGNLQGSAAVATTSASLAFVANPGDSEISAFLANGTATAFTPLVGGGMNAPTGLAVDGSDIIWTTNSVANTGGLSAFTATGTAHTSASLGALQSPIGIAVDASGNIWTANSGDNTLTEFVGLASPVVTPLAARIQ